MATIPTEVVESCILPRLPVKSLIRFKSVSKSWKTLIPSSKFIHLHNRHANRLLVIAISGPTLLQVHNLDSPLDPPFLCSYPYPDPEQLPRFRERTTIHASCEFFVLVGLSTLRSHEAERLLLVNPSTLCYHRIIPLEAGQRGSNLVFVNYWLYFDEANDDCKVVRISYFHSWENEDSWEIEIYSCKNNTWRFIEDILISRPLFEDIPNYNSVACLNNLLYLLIDPFIEHRIRCFDIQAERWRNDIVFPLEMMHPHLFVLDGSLCVLGINMTDEEDLSTETYTVWVFNESAGFKGTWVKLMSIVSKDFCVPEYRIIAYRKGSQHELLCQRCFDSGLFWYDLKHKVATMAESNLVAGRKRSMYYLCKESLICFHGRMTDEKAVKGCYKETEFGIEPRVR